MDLREILSRYVANPSLLLSPRQQQLVAMLQAGVASIAQVRRHLGNMSLSDLDAMCTSLGKKIARMTTG